jgi:serine/threonine protein kinase
MKIMKKRNSANCNIRKMFNNEVAALSRFDHRNILKLIDYSSDEHVLSPKNTVSDISYLVLEYAENGTMIDYISKTGSFSEATARYFFHQLISAVRYINKKGLAHRDIKAENIMFDSEFNLKLGDFGFATDRNTSNKAQGTLNYMAPELIANLQYNPKQVDLFASAVILFIMVTSRFPFKSAEPSDELYQFIILKDFDGFWNAHFLLDAAINDLSEEFKDLFCSMVIVDGRERLSISEVRGHDWYQIPLLRDQDIYENFSFRKLVKKGELKFEDIPDEGSASPIVARNVAKSKAVKTISKFQKLPKEIDNIAHIYTDYYECEDGDLLLSEIVNFAKLYKYSHKI